MRYAGPVRGHEVLRLHGPDRNHRLVGPLVAHHPHRLHGKKHGEDLIGAAIQIVGDDLLQQDLITVPQQLQPRLRDFPHHSDGQPRTREGVTPDDMGREPQDFAQLSHLVLEQTAQRLDQLESKLLRKPAHVVMQLDVGGRAGKTVTRFDDVRIERSLGEERRTPVDLRGGSFEHIDKAVSDQPALLLRIDNPLKITKKIAPRINDAQIGLEVIAERGLDKLALVLSQQAVIHKDANQLIADGSSEQRGHDGRIHAPA